MTRARPPALVEFAEAPTLSLCRGCAHLQGANDDGTARCAAFDTIPAAIWTGRADHRAPIEGDGGTTFSPLASYGLAIERTFDANRAIDAATFAPGDEDDEDVDPDLPMPNPDEPDDQDGDGEPEDDFPANRPERVAADAEAMENAPAEEFHTLMVVEGVPTGDRRFIEEGALVWRSLPLALMWQTETPENGGHAHSVHVGQITRVERQGSEVHAWGHYLDGAPGSDGARFAEHLREAGRLGVSVDMDDAEVEIDWPEEEGEEGMEALFAEPELVRFVEARLMGATVVPFPAFSEAFVEPLDDADAEAEAALIAAGIPLAPPADWFCDPGLDGPTPLTIEDDGRVYGHLAVWGTCHTSFQGTCVTPPFESSMSYFTTGAVRCDDGADVAVGQLTFGTGHADTSLAHAAALRHYDDTGSSVADLAAGPDAHGIWLAGALRPGTTPAQIRAIRAASVSGDWRRIGGELRLVAALSVNVPGFPIPRTTARVASGAQLALVASGIVARHARRRHDPSLIPVAEMFAAEIGRSREDRVAELVSAVHGPTLGEFACGCGGKKAKAGTVASTSKRTAVTASGGVEGYEIIAPDGTRSTERTLVAAMTAARRVRGRYRVLYS